MFRNKEQIGKPATDDGQERGQRDICNVANMQENVIHDQIAGFTDCSNTKYMR
jgi:hypothetical protein